MIRFVLTRMEKSPSAVFYERELAESFPREFESARREKLLQRVSLPPDGGSYAYGLPKAYALIELEDGTFEAYDEEDPETDPIRLTRADLAQWRLDVGAVAKRFQAANGLKGAPGPLGDRLHFLGELRIDSLSLAFCLGLIPGERSALRKLAAVPNLVSNVYDRFIVVCPTFAPSEVSRRQFESLQIFIVPLGETDIFVPDYGAALSGPKAKAPHVILSDIEEHEFEAARFQSRLPIHITGETVRRKSNLVEVAGCRVALPAAAFKLFLRLVLALCESKDGFLLREALRFGAGIDGEEVLAPEGLDQALGRLREPFRAALGDLVPTQFIEVHGGKTRLSTHRRYVLFDRERLLEHENQEIVALARRLPAQ